MVENDKKRRRPRGDERKDRNLHLRGTKTQMELLDILSYEDDKSKTDVVWKALEFYHNFKKGAF